MSRYEITWGEHRKLEQTDEDIRQYYRAMIDDWNALVKRRGWTNWNSELVQMQKKLVYMHDKIEQTERAHAEELRRLEFELSKWTSQQKGRRSKITQAQRDEINQLRADGQSLRKIAKAQGLSEKTIRRIVEPKTATTQ